jgi:predicted membrane-bound dolichyl-phosphate-mannose-protein mannosyltransferase
VLLALVISVCFAVILLGTIGFPLGTHADEPSKALAVLKHRNNFNHPLLMLHLGRCANALAGFTTAPNVIELGRTLAVIAGALAVFATYLLARQALPAPASLAAATATAVAPLVAMHARFFKEDIFALLFVLFSLLLLIEVLKTPTRGRALLLGVAASLAVSAKYVGALLVPFAFVVRSPVSPDVSPCVSGWSLPGSPAQPPRPCSY